MTAAKGPPERVTLYFDTRGYVQQVAHSTGDGHVYLLEAAVEKRERALREVIHDLQVAYAAARAALAAAGGKL